MMSRSIAKSLAILLLLCGCTPRKVELSFEEIELNQAKAQIVRNSSKKVAAIYSGDDRIEYGFYSDGDLVGTLVKYRMETIPDQMIILDKDGEILWSGQLNKDGIVHQ